MNLSLPDFIASLGQCLDEAEVPRQGRWILVPTRYAKLMRYLARQFGPRPRFRGARGRKRSINWRRK